MELMFACMHACVCASPTLCRKFHESKPNPKGRHGALCTLSEILLKLFGSKQVAQCVNYVR